MPDDIKKTHVLILLKRRILQCPNPQSNVYKSLFPLFSTLKNKGKIVLLLALFNHVLIFRKSLPPENNVFADLLARYHIYAFIGAPLSMKNVSNIRNARVFRNLNGF